MTTSRPTAVRPATATDRAYHAFTNLIVVAFGVALGALLAGFIGLLMNWILISC